MLPQRAHVALSVLPLLGLLLLETMRMWPALDGAPSFAAASPTSWWSLVAWTLVVGVLLVAYARGWAILGGAPMASEALPYRSAGCRRLQGFAGGVAWALVIAHVALRWGMTLRAGPVALSHYELLRGYLSKPPVLAFYLIGLASIGLFLSQGIAASFRAWGYGTRPESSLRLEIGCTVGSAALMLVVINVLSHFVTGRAYWSPS